LSQAASIDRHSQKGDSYIRAFWSLVWKTLRLYFIPNPQTKSQAIIKILSSDYEDVTLLFSSCFGLLGKIFVDDAHEQISWDNLAPLFIQISSWLGCEDFLQGFSFFNALRDPVPDCD